MLLDVTPQPGGLPGGGSQQIATLLVPKDRKFTGVPPGVGAEGDSRRPTHVEHDVAAAEPGKDGTAAGSAEDERRPRALIEERHPLVRGALLLDACGDPWLRAARAWQLGGAIRLTIEVRHLPTRLADEAGASLFGQMVDW